MKYRMEVMCYDEFNKEKHSYGPATVVRLYTEDLDSGLNTAKSLVKAKHYKITIVEVLDEVATQRAEGLQVDLGEYLRKVKEVVE